MKLKYLLPHKLKRIGWLVFIPTLVIGGGLIFFDDHLVVLKVNVVSFFNWNSAATIHNPNVGGFISIIENNIVNEIIGILLILSSMAVAFSKEKDEDELISKIRLESLVWSVYWNYGILLLAIIFLYDTSFFTVMIFNMFTVLFFFIIKFNLAIRRLRKTVGDEK